MSIDSEYIFFSLSPDRTIKLGHFVASELLPKTLVTLTGDLGSGKTTFVKGLACGLGVPNAKYVNSPTYNIVHTYIGQLELYHVDLYRLGDYPDTDEIGLDEFIYSDGITVVEWPGQIHRKYKPVRHLDVKFRITDDFKRDILLTPNGFIFDKNISDI